MRATPRPWIFLLGLLPVAMAAGPPTPRSGVAWAAGPLEARVALDRPADAALVKAVVGRSIEFTEPARVPDARQGKIKVAAARLDDDGRTLVLVTDPHPREASYILTLEGFRINYDLGGVEVLVGDDLEKPSWSGWWPTLDPAEARTRTKGSVEHARGFALIDRPGTVRLRTLITLPKGQATLTLVASRPFEATLGSEAATSTEAGGKHRASLTTESTGDANELAVTLKPGPGPLMLAATAHTAADPAEKPLTSASLTVPWAPATPPASAEEQAPVPDLSGGDPKRGEAIFYSTEAKCATCHMVRGKGGNVGPDLTAYANRDRAWLYRNILAPSASIHPEYVSFTVARKSGQVAMGVIRAEGADQIRVSDIDAKSTLIPRSDVEELRPSASSIMPVGLLGAIGDAGTRDLLAFLTAPMQASSR